MWRCWDCNARCGEEPGFVDTTLAPGEWERLVRDKLAQLVSEFEAALAKPIGPTRELCDAQYRPVQWWRDKFAALLPASPEDRHDG